MSEYKTGKRYRVFQIISEYRPRKDWPKGYMRVQAVVQLGRDINATKHIFIPCQKEA